MRPKCFHLVAAALAIICGVSATPAADVTWEKGEVRDGRWVFPKITGPSENDLGSKAVIRVIKGKLDQASQPASTLTDGVVSVDAGDPDQALFFTQADAGGGRLVMDLGSIVPIRQINTYSRHEWNVDQGSRAPQVYTLYGSAEASAAPDHPETSAQWTKIADVDTRPNKTGENWGGIYGVQISSGEADLGRFRYLLWDVRYTRSPLEPKPEITATFFTEFDVHTADTLAHSKPAKLYKPTPVEQVIIVFKTHFDIGYTDMASNVVKRYRTKMIDDALTVVDQNRDLPKEQQFAWTIPGWPMKMITSDWSGQTPERKQRIMDAYKDGRFVVHALPFTTHTETLEAEDLVRGMRFSSEFSRANGKELPRDAKMTDVPCHTWFMATMLKNAGVDFLHIGCNGASSTVDVPPLFWWEGPDGSRLLTMYSSDYGTSLMPPKNWPYKTWLALTMTGDNHGPPRPDEVKHLLNEARERLPGVKVHVGRMSDFADAIFAEKANLPVVRADLPDTWIHGPMSDPAGASIARNIRPVITATEALNTELRAWGVAAPNIADTLALSYENSLLYGEHTWGGGLYFIADYSKGGIVGYGDTWKADRAKGRFNRIEGSWDEHTAYIKNARDLITPVEKSDLQLLAQSVGLKGPRIVVYNPLPWKRDGLVTVKAEPGITGLKPVGGDEPIPVETNGDSIRFIARNIPAMGYRTFVPISETPKAPKRSADAKAGVIENSFFKVTFDPGRGIVRSLIDKKSGRELVDASASQGLGQYLYERFDADQTHAYLDAYTRGAFKGWPEFGKPGMPPAKEAPYRAASPKNFELTVEETPVSTAAIMKAQATGDVPNAITTKVILYRGLPYVDVEITVGDKPLDPWPEAGWICLPLRVESPQFRLGRIASIVDPAKDIPAGSNHDLLWLNSGLTVSDPNGRGIGICPLDHPLVSLDRPGCWKYSREFTPKQPKVYVNLFNNQWNTNFRLWNEGTWMSRVRLWTFEKFDAEPSLVTPCWEGRYPLQAAFANGAAGKLPPRRNGLEFSRRGVLVTAFGPNPDGAGTILRLWEHAGQTGECIVHLPDGIKVSAMQPVNLRGVPSGEPIAVTSGRFKVQLKAFAPASFLIQP